MNDKALEGKTRVALLDNGSLSPKSILQGRTLARRFGERVGMPVDLVSVAHSDRVPAEELEGERAWTWASYLQAAGERGIESIQVVPLFFGPSFGLRKARSVAEKFEGPTRVEWADCLVTQSDADDSLVDILVQEVIQALDTSREARSRTRVLLVDHGSPFEEVTACRDWIGDRMRSQLGSRVESVVACSMERREGEAYDFNEPTLEAALNEARASGVKDLLLSYLFLFPGRHAGLGGDIDVICAQSRWEDSERIGKCELLGSNPQLLEVLDSRLRAIVAAG